MMECDVEILEGIKKQVQCENDEIHRLYLEANPDAIAPVEIRAEKEGDRFYLPLTDTENENP